MAGKAKNTWYLGLPALIGVIVVAILFIVQPPYGLDAVVRAAGLLGYLALFLAIVSSAYSRELVRFFGRPFVKVHHITSVAGLALLILHPLAATAVYASATVLLPRVSSVTDFLTWAGPPGLYLFLIASAAALLRRTIKGWRALHYLTYLGFLLGTIHAVLLGTDGQRLTVRLVVIAMAMVVVLVFARKRLETQKRRQRPSAST